MIIFDFDKTLYQKDSLITFHLFMIRRYPLVVLWLPLQAAGAVMYKLKILGTQQFKNLYLCYMAFFSENRIIQLAKEFWAIEYPKNFDIALMNIIQQHAATIVIITASPEIYIKPLLETLHIRNLIGTVIKKRGAFYTISGANCKGEEKVKRLYEEFGKTIEIEAMYTDSMSDLPLLRIATHPFLIDKGRIVPFK